MPDLQKIIAVCARCERQFAPINATDTMCPACKYDTLNREENSKTILDEAALLVDKGPREQEYGPPQKSFKTIAAGWSAILGVEVTPTKVGLCMIWLKIMRENAQHKRDNLVDIAGYARLVERILGE